MAMKNGVSVDTGKKKEIEKRKHWKGYGRVAALLAAAAIGIAASTGVTAMPVRAQTKKVQAQVTIPEEVPVTAKGVYLYDMRTGAPYAVKNEKERLEPGDFTRLCALLVACENIYSTADRVTVTKDILDTVAAEGGTCLFKEGESVSVQDLLYAAVLTGADDAVLALGRKAAGNDAIFTALLNRKANQLGLANTMFMNATGIPGQGSYTCAEDVGKILRAVMQNKKAYAVILQDAWTIGATAQHPNGIQIGSSYKTAMNIMPVPGMDAFAISAEQDGRYGAISMFTTWGGRPYLCVTLGSDDYVQSINDQANIFLTYLINK